MKKDYTISEKTLVDFFKAHDERRGTDFKKTFPELADFYDYTLKLNR